MTVYISISGLLKQEASQCLPKTSQNYRHYLTGSHRLLTRKLTVISRKLQHNYRIICNAGNYKLSGT